MLWAKEMLELFFLIWWRAIDQSVESPYSYLHYKHSHQQKVSPMLRLGWLWAPSSVFMELLHSLSFCLALTWLPHLRLWSPQPRSFISLLKDPLNESAFQPRDQNSLKTIEWAHNTLSTSVLACALHTDRQKRSVNPLCFSLQPEVHPQAALCQLLPCPSLFEIQILQMSSVTFVQMPPKTQPTPVCLKW